MYHLPQLAFKYAQYIIQSLNGKGHGTHSPFVYDFIVNVLNNKKTNNAVEQIEALRKELLQDATILTVEDFGAGSKQNKTKVRAIKDIAKSALKPKKYSYLIQKIVAYYQLNNCLELGTCLGITSSYIANAHAKVKLITAEGSKEIAREALTLFKKLKLNNIQLIEGNFDITLNDIVQIHPSIDFAFIDGNHQYQATIDYATKIMQHCNNDSVLILDDIYWSKGMEDAWLKMKEHPQVTASIDLFYIGILLFRKEFKEKQHFKIFY